MPETYFEFEKTAEPVYTSEPFYDLFDSNRFRWLILSLPRHQQEEIRQAIISIRTFLDDAETLELLEYI